MQFCFYYILRYAILTKETWPKWKGDVKSGIKHLMKAADINDGQWQIGKSKLFIKDPESVSRFAVYHELNLENIYD